MEILGMILCGVGGFLAGLYLGKKLFTWFAMRRLSPVIEKTEKMVAQIEEFQKTYSAEDLKHLSLLKALRTDEKLRAEVRKDLEDGKNPTVKKAFDDGMIRVKCQNCNEWIAFFGRITDCPECLKCGTKPDMDLLKKIEREMIDKHGDYEPPKKSEGK